MPDNDEMHVGLRMGIAKINSIVEIEPMTLALQSNTLPSGLPCQVLVEGYLT